MKCRILPGGRMPAKKHPGDAGYDVYAPSKGRVEPGSTKRVPLGLALEIPEGTVCLVQERSSQAAKGVSCHGNVIDSGYRGEIHAVLSNHGFEIYQWEEGDRICQLLFIKLDQSGLEESKDLSATDRGEGGFGSTGI